MSMWFLLLLLWPYTARSSGIPVETQILPAVVQPFHTLIYVDDSPKEGVKTFEVWVTAYSPRETCRGPCITAVGRAPTHGRTIACPRSLPFGTRVNVGEHQYVCEDRTARRYDGRFDIFMEDYDQAVAWGKRWEKIKVIE